MQDHSVIIIGAGIGGLSAALALARHGIESQVFERRELVDEAGAGIQIGPNGTRILKDLGVAPWLADKIATPEAIRVIDGISAKVLTEAPLGKWIEKRHGAPYWVAHRADLHAALASAANDNPKINITTQCEVVQIAPQTTGDAPATVTTADGHTLEGAAVICADGLWSGHRNIIRRAGTDSGELRYSGKSAARTVIPAEDVPAEISLHHTTVWLAPHAHIVHYPVRQHTELAIVVILEDHKREPGWNSNVEPAWITNGTPWCPPLLRKLLEGATSWRKWALYEDTAPNSTWSRGNVALLGDAAHPILPFLAQGAVMAIEDADVMASCLAACIGKQEQRTRSSTPAMCTVPAALQRYAQERRGRVSRVQRASQRNGNIYHLSGPIAAARNLTLTLTPGHRLMASYDWLYGWRGM